MGRWENGRTKEESREQSRKVGKRQKLGKVGNDRRKPKAGRWGRWENGRTKWTGGLVDWWTGGLAVWWSGGMEDGRWSGGLVDWRSGRLAVWKTGGGLVVWSGGLEDGRWETAGVPVDWWSVTQPATNVGKVEAATNT